MIGLSNYVCFFLTLLYCTDVFSVVNTGCPVSSTVVMPSSSTPYPPVSTLAPSPTPTPSTTLTLSTHPTTDDNTPEPAEIPSPTNNTGLIIGFVVALLVIIVIAVTAIVIVVVIMKRRQSKQGSVDTTAWSNPSYEDRELH